jgi:transcriptional regulator with XRE-family HTH domain
MAAKHRTREHRALQRVLRALRQESGITQAGLAEVVGRPQSYVSKVESGERKADLPELDELCRALGTNLETLVRRYKRELG